MRGSRRSAAVAVWLTALLFAGCNENTRTTDGRIGEGSTSCPNGYDNSVDISTAVPLAAGTEGTGNICPIRDSDFFKIEHTGSLLKVELTGTLEDSGTPIQLTYLVLDKDGKVVGSAPPWSGAGVRHFVVYHCLQPGTYYLQVKDEGDDAKDGNNVYRLKFDSAQDKDTNEPANNDPTGATAPGTGYISCKGDLDWFTFTVTGNQLAEVQLKTDKTTPLALKYSIYDADGKTKILEEGGDKDGTKAPISIDVVHALPKAGTYLILVEDNGDSRNDPEVPYALTVTPQAETDTNEGTARNDTPATATDCGSGCTKTGQINSKGDFDYYKVDVSGVSATNVGVIEIEVDFGSATTVQPQIGLLYADELSPCTKDSCCRVLGMPTGSCTNNDVDCQGRTYSCIKKDDTYCQDAECNPTPNCLTEQACAGATICLPNKLCAGEQVSRTPPSSSPTPWRVITAQPLLHPGPFYVRVGDFKNDNWDYGRNYTLKIQARLDPDGSNEPNSDYFPNLVPTNIDTAALHKTKAKPSYTMTIGTPLNISGYISYEGDEDWYKVTAPGSSACHISTQTVEACTLTVSYSASGDCSNVQPIYEIRHDNGKQWFGWPDKGQPLSGNPGCVYLNGGSDSGTLYITVNDYNNDGWSWSCHYNLSIAVAAGCNSPCVIESGTSGSGCTVP